jgi:hypothetical protein
VVNADITYDRADYVRAIRFMSRRQNRVFNWILAVGAIVFALLLYRAYAEESEWWMILGTCGLVVFFYLLARTLQTWNIGRQLKNAPDALLGHHWVISDAGIATKSELSSTEIKWEAVTKFRESKTDFFFYTAPRFAKFLPKRSLPDEQQRNELRRMAMEQVGRQRSQGLG